MTRLRVALITACLSSFVLAYPVDVGGRRFVDVPSRCGEGMSLSHAGDCVVTFLIGNSTTNHQKGTSTGNMHYRPSNQNNNQISKNAVGDRIGHLAQGRLINS